MKTYLASVFPLFHARRLVSTGQTIQMLKYHRHHHRAAGPIVDIVTSTKTILVPVPVCPLSPATISTLCRYLCSQLFPRQCKYRADIQLEMWIYWFSSALCCGCCGNLSSFTAGEGQLRPQLVWLHYLALQNIQTEILFNTVVMALSKNTANSNHAWV